MFFLLIITSLLIETQAENICSQNHAKWIQHKTNQSNFVKDWVKSLAFVRNQHHAKGIKVLWKKYQGNQENILEFITKMDEETGLHLGKGWKVAYHYRHEEPYHAGFFHGKIDESNEISGRNVTFVYPDFKTVLFGQFDNRTMLEAFEGKISAYKCTDGILDLKIKIKIESPIHYFDPPTKIRITSNVSTKGMNLALRSNL